MMDRDIENYYRQRAEEYDAVYRKPERQGDIAKLGQRLTELLQGHRVLEVAAGTGFWTERITSSVTSLVATDAVEDTLAVARRRDYGGTPVDLIVCDAFALDRIPGTFDAGLACFWLSHLTRDQMRPFLDHLNSRLEPNSRVVLVDNRYVAGSNHPITRTDHAGNTYQRRVLNSGQQFEILKNFLNHHELHDLAHHTGANATAEVLMLDQYWLLTYNTQQWPEDATYCLAATWWEPIRSTHTGDETSALVETSTKPTTCSCWA